MDKFTIKNVARKDCAEFLKKYHYMSKQGCVFRCGYNYGLYDEGDKLVGVCIFHSISAGETIVGCFGLDKKDQAGFWELGRLALDDEHHGNNTLSWFLSQCIKRLRKDTYVRAILSYADSEYHHGGIYQATNFKYYGLTAKKKDFWILKDDGTYKKQGRGSTIGKEGEWRDRSRKHRYLKVFDKSLTVKWKEQPYPKSGATV